MQEILNLSRFLPFISKRAKEKERFCCESKKQERKRPYSHTYTFISIFHSGIQTIKLKSLPVWHFEIWWVYETMDNRMEIECHFSESRKFYYTTDIRTILVYFFFLLLVCFFFAVNIQHEMIERKRERETETREESVIWLCEKHCTNNEDRGKR